MALPLPSDPPVKQSRPPRASSEAAAARFIESMGLAHEDDRLQRFAGRLLGLLILSPEPVRFDHLAQRLRVSRASISTNTRLLETMGAIERVTRPGDRRDYFQVNQEPTLLQRVARRFQERKAMAEEMKRALTPDVDGNEVVSKRLERLIQFYSILSDSLSSVLTAFEDGRTNRL